MNADRGASAYDVIIVGAGPTGLTLANLLGLSGLAVLLLERNATTVTEPRAVSIDDESLRTMQAAGVIDAVMSQVVPGYGSRYLTAGGACFLTVRPSGQPYGYPRRNAFRQPVLEQQLRDGLARFVKVDCRFGASLDRFIQDERGVTVSFFEHNELRNVWGRYLVGCDGAASPTRKALGIELKGQTLPERWLIIDLAHSPAERDTVVFCDADRPSIALPGPAQTRRFEFKLFPGEDNEAILRPAMIQNFLTSRGAAPESRIVRQTVYTFHARIADRWRVGRVFLAGDAAHLTPPFAGQGMNSGIRDAHNLAWKLAEVVDGRLGSRLLETYEMERREHAAGMIDLALRMGRIMGPASRWRGWLTQTAFRLAGMWPPLRAYFGEMKYKPKPRFSAGFITSPAHSLVGRLLPQPVVRFDDGTERLLDDALPMAFVLLGIDIAQETVEAAAKALTSGNPAIVPRSMFMAGSTPGKSSSNSLQLVDASDPIFSGATGWLLLVRPDRYVMDAFRPADERPAGARVRMLFDKFAA